jgi:hypothetical protein
MVEGFAVDRPAQGLIGLEVSKVLGAVGEVRSLHGALHQVPEGLRNVRPGLERDPSGARLPPGKAGPVQEEHPDAPLRQRQGRAAAGDTGSNHQDVVFRVGPFRHRDPLPRSWGPLGR